MGRFLWHNCVLGLVLIASGMVCVWAEADNAVSSGKVRTYYIAAEELTWDYAPGGINQITGKPFGEAENFWVASGPHQIGKVVIFAFDTTIWSHVHIVDSRQRDL